MKRPADELACGHLDLVPLHCLHGWRPGLLHGLERHRPPLFPSEAGLGLAQPPWQAVLIGPAWLENRPDRSCLGCLLGTKPRAARLGGSPAMTGRARVRPARAGPLPIYTCTQIPDPAPRQADPPVSTLVSWLTEGPYGRKPYMSMHVRGYPRESGGLVDPLVARHDPYRLNSKWLC